MTSAMALFGTSADPPTVGHQAVLAGLLQLYPRVCTWASDNPFKEHGAPLEVRAALLGAVVESLAAHQEPHRLQLRQDLSSRRAIDSISAAQRLFPQEEPVFVVGTDLVEQIPRWYAVGEWLGQCRLAVVPRQGWPSTRGSPPSRTCASPTAAGTGCSSARLRRSWATAPTAA